MHAEDFRTSVQVYSEDLSGVKSRLRRKAAREINSILQCRLSRSLVGPRRTHFSVNCRSRYRLEIESAENPYRIERLELRCSRSVLHRRRQVEADHARTEVWRVQTDDLAVVCGRFRQNIVVRLEEFSELHALAVGIASRSQNMALQINRVLVVFRDREDVDFIPILDFEGR